MKTRTMRQIISSQAFYDKKGVRAVPPFSKMLKRRRKVERQNVKKNRRILKHRVH